MILTLRFYEIQSTMSIIHVSIKIGKVSIHRGLVSEGDGLMIVGPTWC